ncbi:hypothetical protein [Rathayibacter sp. VKM Ac-2630]|uniref:hypothetical protein n=1 Tax=Rathayibacter sp. VKM Ac-2630 TaxID=1938617 RepID=UPI000981E6F6|nr:hypothetical protein [Rathayibacter sp. VKM Ac-2630]OOB90306.1 hypothetical protein B0T42_12460 [Rathayibacter sp. VKM Ac-2630]
MSPGVSYALGVATIPALAVIVGLCIVIREAAQPSGVARGHCDWCRELGIRSRDLDGSQSNFVDVMHEARHDLIARLHARHRDLWEERYQTRPSLRGPRWESARRKYGRPNRSTRPPAPAADR